MTFWDGTEGSILIDPDEYDRTVDVPNLDRLTNYPFDTNVVFPSNIYV